MLPQYWGAADAWTEAHGELTPVTPVDAAGVVLLRDSPEGVETYLLTQPWRSPFGPVAFPGGPAEVFDDEPLPWVGPSSTEWASRWKDDVGTSRRVLVAAVRELFEQTGILLAGQDQHTTVETVDGRDWSRVREDLLADEIRFRELLERRRLVLRTDLLWPLARWLTPEFLHRRYDIRYFAVILPERQTVSSLAERPRPGAWVPLARVAAAMPASGAPGADRPPGTGQSVVQGHAHDERMWLGETIGSPHTVGKPQADLLSANVSCLIQDLADVRSVIEAIAHRNNVLPQQPQLRREEDGAYYLVVPPRERLTRTRTFFAPGAGQAQAADGGDKSDGAAAAADVSPKTGGSHPLGTET